MKNTYKREATFYLLCLSILLVLPLFYPDKYAINIEERFMPPQWIHSPHLGTDALGRSQGIRLMHAISTSLMLSISALLTSLLLAMTITISAMWVKSFIRNILLWLPKAFFIIPAIFLSASLFQMWHHYTLALWITLVIAPLYSLTHYLHLSLLSQQNQAYWLYATSTSSSIYYHIRYHQLPYAFWHILPLSISRLSSLIILEGSLSFLGFGLQDPYLSLGLLLQGSILYIQSYPYLFFIPAISFIFLLFLLQWIGLRVQIFLQHA